MHSCAGDNYCASTIVAGMFKNFEEKGEIIVHISFPQAGMQTLCNHTPVLYHKPESKEDRPIRTWHLKEECIGGCKRMEAAGRIMH